MALWPAELMRMSDGDAVIASDGGGRLDFLEDLTTLDGFLEAQGLAFLVPGLYLDPRTARAQCNG